MNAHGLDKGPITAQMFGNAGREHMEKYGKYREPWWRPPDSVNIQKSAKKACREMTMLGINGLEEFTLDFRCDFYM